jgi:SAM-dependent methyltransferase
MRGRKLAPRLDLLATIQGHYAGEALLALLRLGVLDALATPRKSRALARLAGVDHALLEPVLEFVRRTTEVVNRDHAGRYRLGQPSLAEIVFQLEKFIGAYGPSLRGLEATLRGARSSGAPDDRALARAFAAVAGIRPLEGEILRGMGVRGLLDLGCGPGSLLLDLGQDTSFRGIGVDSSAAMCRMARSRVRAAGLQSPIRIRLGDATRVRRALAGLDLGAIDAVHGRSLLNALFGQGPARAVAFLRDLRAVLPGRSGLFVDYYGELGREASGSAGFRLAEVQDLAQLASGQGIPPPHRKAWDSVFRQAGCRLVSVLDVRADGIRWFIRQVTL